MNKHMTAVDNMVTAHEKVSMWYVVPAERLPCAASMFDGLWCADLKVKSSGFNTSYQR